MSDEDYEKLSRFKWTANKDEYTCYAQRSKEKKSSVCIEKSWDLNQVMFFSLITEMAMA